jgi:hypothetical protein
MVSECGLCTLGAGHTGCQAGLYLFDDVAGFDTAGESGVVFTPAAGAFDQITDFEIETMGLFYSQHQGSLSWIPVLPNRIPPV